VRQIKDIFTEYSRMRDNGLDAKTALNVLRPHIELLSKADREELANLMRARETLQSVYQQPGSPAPVPPYQTPPPVTHAPAPPPITQPSVPPVAPAPRPKVTPLTSIKPITAPPIAPPQAPGNNTKDTESVVWVNCPNCGKTNQKHEVFCYACGHLLEPVKGAYDTRQLDDKDNQPLDSEYFGPDSVLVLRVRGSTDGFETRPQKSDQEIVIGRSTKGSVLAPDIDLTNKQGVDLGVSRLHLSIRYDAEHNTVLVSDLGSANGSFINGQRIAPKEVRVLRHGDELRLGKMVMMVSFRHPGR
jgi:hypothetical protein